MDSRTKKPRVDNPVRATSNYHYVQAKEFQSEGNYNHALASYEDAASAIAELPLADWGRADFLQVLKILGKMMGLIANNKIEYPQAPDESEEAYGDRVWESTTHRIDRMTRVMNQLSEASAQMQKLNEVEFQAVENSLAPASTVVSHEHSEVELVFSPLHESPDVMVVTDEEILEIKSPASYRYSSFERALFHFNEAEMAAKDTQPLLTSIDRNFK